MKKKPLTPLESYLESSLELGDVITYDSGESLILGCVIEKAKNKYVILNIEGSQIHLPRERLYKIPNINLNQDAPKEEIKASLKTFLESAIKELEDINLELLWESKNEDNRAISLSELCEEYFGKDNPQNHLALRLAIVKDKIFFKRQKERFIPRSKTTVEELRKAKEREAKRLKALNMTADYFKKAITGKIEQKPPSEVIGNISLLKLLAADGTQGEETKEARKLLRHITDTLNLELMGSSQERAFQLLCKSGIFKPDENLALIKYRIRRSFSASISTAAKNITIPQDIKSYIEKEGEGVRRDLTHLPAFTIDDISTKDMDDALSLEISGGIFSLGVHITDISSAILPGSPLDREAMLRATSLYCPDCTVNMFPPEISEKLLSLVKGQIRPCMTVYAKFDSSYNLISTEVFLSLIKVQENYTYDLVDAILKGEKLENIPIDKKAQLSTFRAIADKLLEERVARGAIHVTRKDVTVKINTGGNLELIVFDEASPARSLIGEMMIFANGILAQYALDNEIPIIFRSQPAPDTDPYENPQQVPPGPAFDYLIKSRLKRSITSVEPGYHSSLALNAYTQATSPIRRYLDLCSQRQLAFALKGKSLPYSKSKLQEIIYETEATLGAARTASQEAKRYWILKYLEQERAKNPTRLYEGTVIRVDLRKPLILVEEIYMPSLLEDAPPLSPGDRIAAQICSLNPRADLLKFKFVQKL